MWVGEAGKDILWYPGEPNFFFSFFLNCFLGALHTPLKDKGWFLDPLFWSTALDKRGHSIWWQYHSGTFPESQKQRPYQGSYIAIQTTIYNQFHISQYLFQISKPQIKVTYEALLFRACSIMPSRLSAVSMWFSPSLLYLSNTEFIYSFSCKYSHCICNWFYCCSAASLCRANLVPINARHLVSGSIKRVWEMC